MHPRTKHLAVAIATMALLAFAGTAQATNLVTNGSFESNGGNGQFNFTTTATGWSVPSPGYTFLFAPGTADTSGATGQYGFLALWGPGNGAANGLPATSPDGGYYIAQDSDFQPGALTQTITGLTPGHSYTVGFWWAAAQQYQFDGPTYDAWIVSLGSSSQTTATVNIPSHGFSGWMYQSFTLTADNTSDVLSFFAVGGPSSGVPPFALLDGVTLTETTPEPGTLALLGSGLLGGLGVIRSKSWFKR